MAFDTLASRTNAFLRLLLTGTSGAGKTYSALRMAKALGGKRIGLLDSEHGSASKYAGLPEIPPFFAESVEDKTIQEYLEKIAAAARAKVDVLVVDSYSHAWQATLDLVDKTAGSKFSNGWKQATPLWNQMTHALLTYPGHIICTGREKADWAVEMVNGKAVPKKLGLAAHLRDGTDYEFDVVIALTPEGGLSVSKTRCPVLTKGTYTRDDVEKIAGQLKTWLSEGAVVDPAALLLERIRGASEPGLQALTAEIAAHVAAHPTDRERFQKAYMGRKSALAEGGA